MPSGGVAWVVSFFAQTRRHAPRVAAGERVSEYARSSGGQKFSPTGCASTGGCPTAGARHAPFANEVGGTSAGRRNSCEVLQGLWVHQVPNVNGEELNDFALDSTEEIRHTTIEGIPGATSCTRTSDEITSTFYDGGVMGEIRRSANLVYRSFQFKKPADRDAAIAVSTDTINPGLKYAHSFAGLNGCAIEIVLEVSIKAGGGVEVIGSFPFESIALERELAVRGSVAVCKTSQEIIALAGAKELRESQNVEYDPTCETGKREVLRFSRTFVCKATGESVEASFEFETIDGTVSDISSDCNNPTTYQSNPPGEMVLHQAASFKMLLDASQAPESCGAMCVDSRARIKLETGADTSNRGCVPLTPPVERAVLLQVLGSAALAPGLQRGGGRKWRWRWRWSWRWRGSSGRQRRLPSVGPRTHHWRCRRDPRGRFRVAEVQEGS